MLCGIFIVYYGIERNNMRKRKQLRKITPKKVLNDLENVSDDEQAIKYLPSLIQSFNASGRTVGGYISNVGYFCVQQKVVSMFCKGCALYDDLSTPDCDYCTLTCNALENLK
jgi:hypothetical protein